MNNNTLSLSLLPYDLLFKVSHYVFADHGKDAVHLFNTCKTLAPYKKGLHKQWPYFIRERVIAYLRDKTFSELINQTLTYYKQLNPLLPHHGTHMIHACLQSDVASNQHILTTDEKMYGLTQTLKDPTEPLHSIIRRGEYETAFAYAAACNNKKKLSYLINSLIIFKGHAKALDYILLLTQGQEQKDCLNNFIRAGFIHMKCDFNEFNVGDPFVQTLLKINFPLPPQACEFLFNKFILPLENHPTQLFPEVKQDLIKKFYTLLPNEFDFNLPSIDIDKFNTVYKDPLYNEDMIPFAEQTGISEAQTKNFINRMEKFPHLGLSKKIVDDILDGLYLDDADMGKFWSSLHQIEKHFKLQRVVTPGGIQYYDRATETYMIQLLSNSEHFMDAIESNPQFCLAVARVFTICPTWLEDNQYSIPEVYECVVGLLKKHLKHTEVRLLIGSIQDPTLKSRMWQCA